MKTTLSIASEWNFCLSTNLAQSILLGSTSNLESIFPRCYTRRIRKKLIFWKSRERIHEGNSRKKSFGLPSEVDAMNERSLM